jgi:hypothetical protein
MPCPFVAEKPDMVSKGGVRNQGYLTRGPDAKIRSDANASGLIKAKTKRDQFWDFL